MHPMMTKISKEDQEVSVKVKFNFDLCSFNCSVKRALLKRHRKDHDSQKISEEVSKEKGQRIEQIEEAICMVCDVCEQKFWNK